MPIVIGIIVLLLILYFVVIPILKALSGKLKSLLGMIIALGVIGMILMVCIAFPILFIPLILFFFYSKSQANSLNGSENSDS